MVSNCGIPPAIVGRIIVHTGIGKATVARNPMNHTLAHPADPQHNQTAYEAVARAPITTVLTGTPRHRLTHVGIGSHSGKIANQGGGCYVARCVSRRAG